MPPNDLRRRRARPRRGRPARPALRAGTRTPRPAPARSAVVVSRFPSRSDPGKGRSRGDEVLRSVSFREPLEDGREHRARVVRVARRPSAGSRGQWPHATRRTSRAARWRGRSRGAGSPRLRRCRPHGAAVHHGPGAARPDIRLRVSSPRARSLRRPPAGLRRSGRRSASISPSKREECGADKPGSDRLLHGEAVFQLVDPFGGLAKRCEGDALKGAAPFGFLLELVLARQRDRSRRPSAAPPSASPRYRWMPCATTRANTSVIG